MADTIIKCDCRERIGTEINSWKLFEELKDFFETQIKNNIFSEADKKMPFEINDKWEVRKFYQCNICKTLWEFKYPVYHDRPSGRVSKFFDGIYEVNVKVGHKINNRKCHICEDKNGTVINSKESFRNLKKFFEYKIKNNIFSEIKEKPPYYVYHNNMVDEVKRYADKLYQCNICGTIWEIKYPNFPARGRIRKFPDGYKTDYVIG